MFLRILIIQLGILLVLPALNAQQSFFPIKKNKKWGLINQTGKLIMEPIYESISSFNQNGWAIAQKDGRLGILDTNAQEVIPCQYDLLEILNDTLLSVKDAEGWKIISDENKVYIRNLSGSVKVEGNGYISFERATGRGLAHIKKGILIDAIYESYEVDEFYIKTWDTNYKMGLYNIDGQKILEPIYKEIRFVDKIIFVREKYKWGAFYPNGDTITAPQWDSYKDFGNNFLEFVKRKEKHLFAVPAKRVILSEYDRAVHYSDSAIIVNIGGQCGMIDYNGDYIYEVKYSDILPFGEGTCRLNIDEKWGVISFARDTIIPFVYDYIGALKRTVAVVSKNNRRGVINQKGKLVLDLIYNSLPLANNMIRIESESKGLLIFAFDEEGNLTSEENYRNFKKIKILGTSRPSNTSSRFSGRLGASAPSRGGSTVEINDSLYWFYNAGTQRWGVRNRNTKTFVISPKYSSIDIRNDVEFTIVGSSKYKLGGEYSYDFVSFTISKVFGLVSNKRGLPITKMELLDIRMTDFTEKDLPVARCIFIGGAHGLINRQGRIIARGYRFIGEFEEGKARFCQKGEFKANTTGEVYRHLGDIRSYMDSWRCGYTFLELNNPIFEQELMNRGVIEIKDAKWGYLDANGNIIIKPEYEFVENFHDGTVIVKKNGKWGMIDEDNSIQLDIVYSNVDYLKGAEKNLLMISNQNRKYGCIDSMANQIVPMRYERVRRFEDGMIAVRRNGKWGFVNMEGKEIIPCIYRSVHDFHEGLAAVMIKGRWGFVDKQGNEAIKAEFSRLGDFHEGLAWAKSRKKTKGYINQQGVFEIEGNYSKMSDFHEGLACVDVTHKGVTIIDREGTWITKPKEKYRMVGDFTPDGLIKMKKGKKHVLLDREGKQVTKGSYAQIREFNNGVAVVRKNQPGTRFLFFKKNAKYGFINEEGKLIGKLKYKQLGDFNSGRALFVDKGKYGYLDTLGQVIVKPQYFRAQNFKKGRAVVYNRYNESGIIDVNGDYVVAPKINRIMTLSEGLALVKKGYQKFYFLHEDLKRHSTTSFEKAYAFNNGVAPVQTKGKWGIVNNKGMIILTPKYNRIDPYENGAARVLINSLRGVATTKGEVIIPADYEYVSFVGEGLFRVERGDAIGYLDMNGAWVWEMQE
ncbi:MAG: WG repeat-containing protein [Saprospiraceae bacterium]|nr:WG repeat-containing protein [Saprospiraceae bacterium]